MNVLAPVRPPYPADRMADWRAKYARVSLEIQLGTEPAADPDAPERRRARYETVITILAALGVVVVAFAR